jgi:biopolymer transport protein ExbD
VAKRPRRGNPDLNVTSFCDIITVTIVALFMVMVIVIDIALRTPKVRPTPLAIETTNQPVYVECRHNQIFHIDRVELTEAMRSASREIRARVLSGEEGAMELAMSIDVGNETYRLDNSFMMMGVIALIPRPGAPGMRPPSDEEPEGPFSSLLNTLSTGMHYLVYLVRDDSFEAFRAARDYGARRGFLTGWEYLDREEPITFEGLFSRVKAE